MFSRDLMKASVLGMLVFVAACGGGEQAPAGGEQGAAPAGDAAAPAAEAPAAAAPAPATQGTTHTVKMVTTQGGASGVFEPAEITVKKGDLIRFTTDGAAPHNVSFPAGENPAGAALPAAGPYLATADQTYDVPVTMDAGSYTVQCDPHAAMGMKAKITVQ